MLKTDEHMKRIKDKLLLEQARLAAVEARRRQKESGSFQKATAAERQRERAADKRGALDAINQFKKHKSTGGASGGAEEEEAAAAAFGRGGAGSSSSSRGGSAGGRGGRGAGAGGRGGSKRARKDAAYGFGGAPKRFERENSAQSSGDMSGFSSAKMKKGASSFGRGGRGGGGGGGRGRGGSSRGGSSRGGSSRGGSRPGKSVRNSRGGGSKRQ
jgi:rRNA-processing protein EBP2